MDDHDIDDQNLPQLRIVTEARGVLLGWRREPPPEPRMHIQALSGPHELLVYLESANGGRRAWEVAVGDRALADAIGAAAELDRPTIEAQWLAELLGWGLISISRVEGCWLHLVVCACEETGFTRRLHLRRELSLLRPPDRADAYSLTGEPVPSILVCGVGMPARWRTRVPIRTEWIWR